MARENLDQPKLIEDERVANVPAQFVLTDDVLRLWSSLPDDQRHWQDMVDVVNALNEITGSHSELKKRTIIALVQAKLRNKPARSVFDEKEYCNESTWHKRWKHDPLIMRVYEFVLSAATTFSGAAEAVNILEAKRYVQNATPLAAQVLAGKMASLDESIALRAALEVLKLTKTFADDGPAVVVNNHANASHTGVSYDEWRAAAEEGREEAEEAIGMSMAFAEIEDEDNGSGDYEESA